MEKNYRAMLYSRVEIDPSVPWLDREPDTLLDEAYGSTRMEDPLGVYEQFRKNNPTLPKAVIAVWDRFRRCYVVSCDPASHYAYIEYL